VTDGRPPTRERRAIGAWLLLVLVLGGVVALYPDLALVWVVVASIPFVVVAVCRRLSGPPLLVGAGLLLGAAVVPLFALLGADWAWARAGGGHLPPLLSLVVGAAIVWLAAVAYLRPWWVRQPMRRALAWAAAVAVVLVLVPPVVVMVIGQLQGSERPLTAPPTVVSELDVVVLSEAGEREEIDPARTRGWRIRPYAGTVAGEEVRWGRDGPPLPAPPAGADRIVLLLVDGAPARLDDAAALPDEPRAQGEVARWLGLVDGLALGPTPTFALLQTTDEARLGRWREALRPRGGETHSLQELAGRRTLTDLALRFGVLASTSDSDLALAAQHRPALFFDDDEPYPRPLNVDQLLTSGKLRLCNRGQEVRALCAEIDESADLNNGADHIAFDPDELAEVRADSTIYVNVTRSGNDHADAIYLDYWWYFPHNPTGAGGGAFCGAGFVIAGVTCHDHQSDWEGVTVILDGDSQSDAPTAVTYAQHNRTSRYTWAALQELWDRGGERARFGEGIDTTRRPLVFVAQGTHASYPRMCRQEKCAEGGVPGIGPDRPLRENRHDGRRPWFGNQDDRCASICLAALPTRRNGAAARWNAFDGYWGSSNCALGLFCSSSPPPRAPAEQPRYDFPWCATETFSFDGGAFARTRHRGCPGRVPSAAELQRGDTLLALGDSFSSGQGAGSYDPDTTGDGNTCFRSRLAWPQLLARRLSLVSLPSLACSGAVTRHVSVDDPSREEPERRRSQVGRISGEPDVVTITIGGNDVGFAGVVERCVLENDCTRRYRTPAGDLLDREIARLAARLPGVYEAARDAAPNARLVVVGYPRLFPEGRPSSPAADNCAAARRVSTREAAYLNDRTRALNAAIAGAARLSGAEFVDVTEAFDGAELRCTGASFVNRLRLREKLFPASFHPTAAGYERLAGVVAAQLAGSGPS
jgi:lysophospholipase L1-like esterase